ncbi:uncharacterized protein YndB with AHSA1/START domain [Kineosphaera limosa]|uniref:Uncharacterized protein n=1 Tax=Kineosphaera limosa NBRC 100340 TaxID=1184609 RepID=K6WRS3_9MICO|nr:SRPBCC family protein [Kineosphaera limosa]NYD99108.1 uncharacterized protein YndB with AHSA1/START domain [Kineosphaera limosa]GAB96531.1 hypothetical protein KILIM_040_00400 [Kineosphaera limosa NBRC 100340]
MSKFTDLAKTSHALSLAAMEEASRTGQRIADIDHLLLALTVNEQSAGQVLRSMGITLAAARAAVSAQHDAQLAALGVQASMPEPGRIVFHETDGYDWSERALDLIKRSADGGRRGDATAVLRELVAEPSGLIEDLLSRLDSSPAAVLTRLDEVESVPVHTSRANTDSLTGTSRAFVPASLEQVWHLLADPGRMPEWDQRVGSVLVGAPPEPPEPGARWSALAPSVGPDGRALKVKPAWRRLSIELIAFEPQTTIAWSLTYPDADRANARIVRIDLAPAAGGTSLGLTLSFERHPDRARRPLPRRLLGPALRPLHRAVIWLQLNQLGSGISRVFR